MQLSYTHAGLPNVEAEAVENLTAPFSSAWYFYSLVC